MARFIIGTRKGAGCGGCRYWSEMIAMSGAETGGQLKAVCLNTHSPKYSAYMGQHEACQKWKSGHLGAIDDPHADPRRYDDEEVSDAQ